MWQDNKQSEFSYSLERALNVKQKLEISLFSKFMQRQ